MEPANSMRSRDWFDSIRAEAPNEGWGDGDLATHTHLAHAQVHLVLGLATFTSIV